VAPALREQVFLDEHPADETVLALVGPSAARHELSSKGNELVSKAYEQVSKGNEQ
jgi:hypothetical protein